MSKTFKVVTNIVSANQSQVHVHARNFILFWQYHIEGSIKIYLYLNFEKEILKIVKVTAVFIDFLIQVHHSHPLACMLKKNEIGSAHLHNTSIHNKKFYLNILSSFMRTLKEKKIKRSKVEKKE